MGRDDKILVDELKDCYINTVEENIRILAYQADISSDKNAMAASLLKVAGLILHMSNDENIILRK